MSDKQDELVWTENYGFYRCILFKGLLRLVVSYESPTKEEKAAGIWEGVYKVSIQGDGSVKLKAKFADVDKGKEAALEWVRRNIAEPKS